MRRPFNKISKKCALAIMSATMVMSNGAHMAMHPVIVYAEENNISPLIIDYGESSVFDNTDVTISSNYGSATIDSGDTVTDNYGHVDNSGGTVENNNSGGTVNNYSGGTVDDNNDGGTVTNNDGGTVNKYSGGTVKDNNSGGSVINYSGGTVEDNNDGGTVTNNKGGTVENNNSGGTVTNNSGGTVEDNNDGGTVTNNDGGTVENNNSGGTVINSSGGIVENNNSGGVVVNDGGTVTNNLIGGAVAGTGSVENNYGGFLEGNNLTVSNQYWKVSITGLDENATANYTSGFTSFNSENYVQTMSGGTVISEANGLITISPGQGYEISGSNMDQDEEQFKYSLIKNGDYYSLIVYPNANTEIEFDQLNLVISAIAPIIVPEDNISSGGMSGSTGVSSGGAVNISSGGTAVVTSGGAINISSGGTAVVTSGGAIDIASGGTAVVTSGGAIDIASGGTAVVTSGGTVEISPADGGQVTSGGTASIAPDPRGIVPYGGTVNIRFGYTVTESTMNWSVSSGESMSLSSPGGVVIPNVMQFTNTESDDQGFSSGSVDNSSDSTQYDHDADTKYPMNTSSITGYIEAILETAKIAGDNMTPTQIVLDFTIAPELTQKDVRELFTSHSKISKRCMFLFEGQKYELVIPAISDDKAREFNDCLSVYENESINGTVSLKRLAEIFKSCGVTFGELK